jgi:hypothetical protein
MGRRRRQQQIVTEEFLDLDLGDRRRTARGRRIARALALVPSASLPVAMADEAALEGLYRHLGNDHVHLAEILLPHVAGTVERVREAGTAYALHDTSNFVFGGKAERKDLGHVNKEKDQGFRAHYTLAVSPDQTTPLGVLAVGTCVRTAKGKSKKSESERWAAGIRSATQHFDDPRTLIHVADRESDIYGLLAEALDSGWRFIFRAAQDRNLLEEDNRLFGAAATAPSMFELEVALSARSNDGRPLHARRAFPQRRARIATLCFAARSVCIQRPVKAKATLPKSVTINVVRVWEPAPPEGEPAVEWLLLTSESIETREDVLRVVEGYRARWLIEIFFNALKTGCAFETRQLESAHSLINLLGYCTVIAYAMLVYRALGRAGQHIPASYILSQRQLRCLRLLRRGKLPPLPSAQQALDHIAALGGHLKRNGPPGWRTLSRGFRKLFEFEEALLLIEGDERCDQS